MKTKNKESTHVFKILRMRIQSAKTIDSFQSLSPMSNHDIPVVVVFTRVLHAALFKLTPSFRV